MNEQSEIRNLKGIGAKTEELFHKMGIFTIGDLLRYYPRGYDVYEEPVSVGELEEGKISTVKGVIYGRVQVGGGKRMQITTAYVKDLTGTLKVIWFRMPFLRNTLKQGMPVIIRGRVVSKKDQLIMEHPELFSPPDSYDKKCGTLQPIYPLTAGMTNNAVAKAVKGAMEYLDLVSDDLPKDLRLRYHLAEYNYAIRGIHFPLDKAEFYHARERLVFEEFLVFVLALRRTRERNERAENGFDKKAVGNRPLSCKSAI